MLEPEKVLDYFADVSLLGTGPVVNLDSDIPSWEVGIESVRAGLLDVELTRAILQSYCDAHPDVPYGMRRVSVVCCLRLLTATDGSRTDPLLLIPGLLDADGRLAPTRWGRAWIPNDKVIMRSVHDRTPGVCGLDALRTHQLAMRSLPNDGSWSTELQHAIDLFESVCTLDEESLASEGLRIRRDVCLVVAYEHPLTSWTAAGVLNVECKRLQDGGMDAISGPLRSLLGVRPNDEEHPESVDMLAEATAKDNLLDLKLLCGLPNHMAPLGQREKQAIVAYTKTPDLPVATLDAPKGTNEVGVALSIMANMLTECALRGDRAPVMLCTGPWDELNDMVFQFSERPKTSQSAIPSRWIPRISNPGDMARRRVLGQVPTPFLLHANEEDPVVPDRVALPQTPGHEAASAGAWYADRWYVPKAATYFLDCASTYLQSRVHDTHEAIMLLSERLRLIDQDRCELIDAYQGLCDASARMRERDNMVSELSYLRGKHAYLRERLVFWSDIAARNPPKRLLVGRAPANQILLITQHMEQDEELAKGRESVSDVCAAYHAEVIKTEEAIERMRRESLDLSRQVRASAPIGERCSEIIRRLVSSCGLSTADASLLESVNDGRDVSLDRLDAILDTTVRPAEFWLAVHVFEARWLDACLKSEAFKRAASEGGVNGLRARAHLCPFSLAPVDSALGAIVADYGDVPKLDEELVDLLVVLDADRMSPTKGAALLGRAKRCFVTGTHATFGPIPLLGTASDELRATQIVGSDSSELFDRHLDSSSVKASLFSALRMHDEYDAGSLRDTIASYGEIIDFRVQLCPDEPLRTMRVPANCADDPGYAFSSMVPSMSYVLVPDSSWERCSGSRRNRAEAMATMRWLSNHADDLVRRVGDMGGRIGLVAPYHSQADLLAELAAALPDELCGLIDVKALNEVGNRVWPLVVFVATCGPESYREEGQDWPARILSVAAAATSDALVAILGSAWARSADEAALALTRRSMRVGRLFSMAREKSATAGSQSQTPVPQSPNLRAKPMSLTALLSSLEKQGEITEKPPTAEANKALRSAGLIERTTTELGAKGWRPTAAGREVGILQKIDRNGNPYCAYAKSAEAVVASILKMLDT